MRGILITHPLKKDCTRSLYPTIKLRVKKYAGLICNGLEVRIKSRAITKRDMLYDSILLCVFV